MTFIPTVRGVRITVEMTIEGQVVLNIYHAVAPDPIVTADLTAIALIVKDWWTGDLADYLSDDIALTGVTARDISSIDGQEVSDHDGLPVVGQVASQAAPNQVAMCVTHYTLFTGRSSRGRSYIPGLPSASLAQSVINTTPHAGIVAAHMSLREALFAVPVNIAVLSFQEDGVARTEGRPRGIVSFAANNRVDTQRRRLPGEGS